MKKLWKRTLAGLLTAALLLPMAFGMTACTEGFRLNRMEESKRAVEFMKVLDMNMSRHANYTTVTENELVLNVYGVEVNIKETTTSVIVYGQGPEDYFVHEETHSTVTEGEKNEERLYR